MQLISMATSASLSHTKQDSTVAMAVCILVTGDKPPKRNQSAFITDFQSSFEGGLRGRLESLKGLQHQPGDLWVAPSVGQMVWICVRSCTVTQFTCLQTPKDGQKPCLFSLEKFNFQNCTHIYNVRSFSKLVTKTTTLCQPFYS